MRIPAPWSKALLDLAYAAKPSAGTVTGNLGTVANVRALATAVLAGMAASTVLGTFGYTASGDGAGMSYVWDPTSVAADDGGTVLRPTAVSVGSPGRFKLVATGSLRPEWFGAFPNGVDCSTALNSALSAAAATGVALELSEGTYYAPTFSLTTTTAQTLIIRGKGRTSVIDAGKTSPNSTGHLVCAGSVFLEKLRFTRCNRVLDMSSVSVAENLHVRDVWMDAGAQAIYGFIDKTTNPGQGIGTGINRIFIQNLVVNGMNNGRAIYLKYDVMPSVVIRWCDLRNLSSSTTHAVAILLGQDSLAIQDAGTANNWTIEGNLIDGVACTVAGAGSANGIVVQGAQQCDILFNRVRNVTNTQGQNCEGIYDKTHTGRIEGNTLIDGGQYQAFIALKGEAREAADVAPDVLTDKGKSYDKIVARNIMRRINNVPGTAGSLVIGIFITHGNVDIYQNTFDGFQSPAISTDPIATNIRNLRILRNIFENMTMAAGGYVINLTSDMRNVEVSGNHFDNISFGDTGGLIIAQPKNGAYKVINGLTIDDNMATRLTGTGGAAVGAGKIRLIVFQATNSSGVASTIQNYRIRRNRFGPAPDGSTMYDRAMSFGGSGLGIIKTGVISGNDFSGCVSTGILSFGSTVANAGVANGGLDLTIETNNKGLVNKGTYYITMGTTGGAANTTETFAHNFTNFGNGTVADWAPTLVNVQATPNNGSMSWWVSNAVTGTSFNMRTTSATTNPFAVWIEKTYYNG